MISKRLQNKKILNSIDYSWNCKSKKSKTKFIWSKQNYLQMKEEKSMKNAIFKISSQNKLKRITQKLKHQENS